MYINQIWRRNCVENRGFLFISYAKKGPQGCRYIEFGKLLPLQEGKEKLITMYGFNNKSRTRGREWGIYTRQEAEGGTHGTF